MLSVAVFLNMVRADINRMALSRANFELICCLKNLGPKPFGGTDHDEVTKTFGTDKKRWDFRKGRNL